MHLTLFQTAQKVLIPGGRKRHHRDLTIAQWRSWPGRQRLNHSCHFCWQNSPPNHSGSSSHCLPLCGYEGKWRI